MSRDTKAGSQQTIGRTRTPMRKLARDDRKRQKEHHHHAQARQNDRKHSGLKGTAGSSQVQTDSSAKPDIGGPNSAASRQNGRQPSADAVLAQKAPTTILGQSSVQRIQSSHDDSRKPTASIIAGAVAGGLVLLLAVLSILFFRRRRRYRAAVRAKAAQPVHTVYTIRDELTESPADSKFPTLTGSSPSRHQLSRYSIPKCLENASLKGVALPCDDSAGRAQQAMEFESIIDPPAPLCTSSKTDVSGVACPSPQSDLGSSSQDAETTLEGDELHIDRCLSYYMKRRTTASVPPEALPHLRSPIALQQNFVVPHSSAQTPDRSTNFKTVNLLERIRRSQIRLDDEALSKAKNEGFRLSKATPQDVPSETILGTSPANSEPHSAFEYADFHESCAPGAHLSLAPQGLSADDPALRWQDHSPSRSSALSPHRSTTVSMRQRSATLSQASSAGCLSSPCADVSSNEASRHRTKRRLDVLASDLESAQIDEVIRF